MQKMHGDALAEFPTPAYDWVGMQGKTQLPTDKAYKYLLKNMQINKPKEYDKDRGI